MKKTLAEHWRDEFEGKGQTPIFWQAQARSLLCAANVLRERARDIDRSRISAPPESEDPPNLRLMPVYVLYGYALENLVKGLLVARGENATWSGTLDKGLRHHCLTDLFRVAHVHTEEDEHRVLEDLRDAIESGKYPVGIRPQNRSRTLGLDVSGDFKVIFALFHRIEDSLRQICLDGALVPVEPSTLGLPPPERSDGSA
ncbi:MAG: hypothetical protein HY657_03775 [Acidobacteria bacterium]|nr:hypothetical protein [Acidobacteriota bacterium]